MAWRPGPGRRWRQGVDRVEIPFERHVLENGLEVVLHEDPSCPLVCVCVAYHVGSAREEPGKSGFAHLFEHLMFEGSQHVGAGGHFKRINEAGGTLNGTTNRDRTIYYETLPAQHLELALWLESDRMGYLLPAITQDKLDNQRAVVKNERRQNYENRPYAKALWPLAEALYAAPHPYHWLTIGSHADLDAAKLEDVHEFFRRWYGPNNATLAIGGDVRPAEALALAMKYFGPIPRGPDNFRPAPRRAVLSQSVRRVVEDDVQLPELTLAWPVCEHYHEDEPALTLLQSILSANKASLLQKALTIDEVLAHQVVAWLNPGEIAGELRVSVRAVSGISLEHLEERILALLDELARRGVDRQQLERQKSRMEAAFIEALETVSSRTHLLAETNLFLSEPSRLVRELDDVLAVTPEQVERMLRKYVLRRPLVSMSVIPRGKFELAAAGRSPAQQEKERTLARGEAPPPAPMPPFHAPAIHHHRIGSLQTLVLPFGRLPVIALHLSLPGGHLRETLEQLGTSMLAAEWTAEGTEELSTSELADRWDGLGAEFRVSSTDDEITVHLRCLARHFRAAMDLLADVLVRPRLEGADFERLRKQRLQTLMMRGDHPRSIADTVFRKLTYGRDSVAGFPKMGTVETVSDLTIDSVRGFRDSFLVVDSAHLAIVGNPDRSVLLDVLAMVVATWKANEARPVPEAPPRFHQGLPIYLVDKPGAAQSEIRIGHAGIARTNPDYDRLMALNYVLGGAFNSRINANLRENKGITYGAFSRFSGGLRPGSFVVWTAVSTQATKQAVLEILKELKGLYDGVSEQETDFARDALMQATSRRFESIAGQMEMLSNILRYGLPDDYLERRLQSLKTMTRPDLDQLAGRYLHPDRVAILVVGDAAKVKSDLESCGLGPLMLLDIDGNPR